MLDMFYLKKINLKESVFDMLSQPKTLSYKKKLQNFLVTYIVES